MRRRILRIVFLLVLIALPISLLRLDAARNGLVGIIAYMRDAGPLGLVVFLSVQVAAALLALPTWLMSGVAGYVYGFPYGFLVALPGTTLSGGAGFLAGRALLRGSGDAPPRESRLWSGVRKAVLTEGLKVTLLLRLTIALPQPILSYFLAVTPLRLREYMIGTFLGMIPSTLLYVYVGSIVKSAAALVAGEASARGPLAWVTLAVGLALTVTALVILSRVAKRALNRALDRSDEAAAPPTHRAA